MAIHLEIECWRKFIRGEQDAFKALYDVYVNVLFSYGTRYCSDEGIVKDSIHDLFIDLHRYRLGLNPDVNVKAYLFSSLRRKVMAAVQKNKSIVDMPSYEQVFLLEWSAEDRAIRNEEESEVMRRLRKEVGQLADRQKEALYLRFACEMNYDQIAQVMEVSAASCRTLIYRAVKQLRRRMEGAPISQLLLILFRQG